MQKLLQNKLKKCYKMVDKKTSKFLSYVLRHNPEEIGIQMDDEGWVFVDQLISLSKVKKNIQLDIEMLKEIVETNDKKRFDLDIENMRIRANQGHSIESVKIKHEDVTDSCPPFLYHGTSEGTAPLILKEGIKKMGRTEVHLSGNLSTAKNVGGRHGKPFIFLIDTKEFVKGGHKIYKSKNGVYLVEYVPACYLWVKGK